MDHHLPVKYALYSHFAYNEQQDYEAWSTSQDCNNLEGIKYLLSYLTGLRQLLTTPAYEGLLVLFYAPGFADCLEGIAAGMSKDDLLSQNRFLKFADDVATYIEGILTSDPELSFRIRFVTPLDLYDIFGRVNWNIAENLMSWFIGNSPSIRYDAPKVVEAIVRLRLLGTGIPVFRLDHDVLFRGSENVNESDLGLFKPIALCLRSYQLRRDEAGIATFLFSASYDTGAITRDTDIGDKFDSWSRAFATRVFPALPVVPDFLSKVGQGSYTWDDYATNVFDEDLARRFYGLTTNGLQSAGLTGIGAIGAHPLVSVISGALFCLSASAILELPPFSNFGINVSWIDDHLKYGLHRELRHLILISTPEPKIEPSLSDANLDVVTVPKFRPPIKDLPKYVLGVYLPTLLWGAIMDAWINPNPVLKYRPEDLSAKNRETWHSLSRKGKSQAVLAAALQTALEKGHIDLGEKQMLEDKLKKIALKRVNEVRREWAQLTNKRFETFASIWAKGTVGSYFPNLDPRCNGLADLHTPLTEEIETPLEINHYLYDDFLALHNDAINYIEWTLYWPQIVQVIRSVEQGTLRTDISWRR